MSSLKSIWRKGKKEAGYVVNGKRMSRSDSTCLIAKIRSTRLLMIMGSVV